LSGVRVSRNTARRHADEGENERAFTSGKNEVPAGSGCNKKGAATISSDLAELSQLELKSWWVDNEPTIRKKGDLLGGGGGGVGGWVGGGNAVGEVPRKLAIVKGHVPG